jgi:riboflavin kinase/FMN adenylyltransferase
MPPNHFVKHILIDKCNLSKLFCGYNFRFGLNATGDIKLIRHLARKLNFSLQVLPPVRINGITVSSSKIRELIEDGLLDIAAKLLTRPYSLSGKIIPGKARGNKLGFPTANINIPKLLTIPPHGVYAATATILNPTKTQFIHKLFHAMVYIGKSPTFNDTLPSIETHLLDFNANIIGKTLKINFLKYLRPDKKFPSSQKLAAQIQKDLLSARKFLDHFHTT